MRRAAERYVSTLSSDWTTSIRRYVLHHLVAAAVCHLREAPQLPGQARAGGLAADARGRDRRSRLARPDGRTYTFTIRTGFRFSPPSNQPVTAQTFKVHDRARTEPGDEGPARARVRGYRRGGRVHGRQDAAHLGRRRATGTSSRSASSHRTRTSSPGWRNRSSAPSRPTRRSIPTASGRSRPPVPTTSRPIRPARASCWCATPTTTVAARTGSLGSSWTIGIPFQRAVADVESGTADYTTIAGPGRGEPARARRRTRCPLRTRQPGGETRNAKVLRQPVVRD